MKKCLLLLAVALYFVSTVDAQSKKYVLFEHFTQASCGPCATQNPAFEAVRAENLGTVHHIAYHTSWPGVDPMNALNPTEVATRVSYYGVTGVPSMHMLGKTWEGSPSGVSSALIASGSQRTAPVRLKISDTRDDAGAHAVSVELIETGDLPSGEFNLRVAVIEKLVSYTSAPGSNGERDFPNTFREMLTPAGGMTYTPSGAGTSQTMEFAYTENAAYNPEELYIIAWLQNEPEGTVINSGSSIDPVWQYVNLESSVIKAGTEQHEFATGYSSDSAGDEIVITLTSDAPDDWSAELFTGGAAVGNSIALFVPEMGTEVQLVVNPGATGAIATFTITAESTTYAGDATSAVSYTVISNVTDLVVDHGGVASAWNSVYTDGLTAAANSTFGVFPVVQLEDAWANGLLVDVENIYENVSWTFPGLTDGVVSVLSEFLDNGGNLFINGQDIGWDTWDLPNGANGTAATQAFYTDYLRADYKADGSASNSLLTWAQDDVFTGIEESAIINIHGGNNIYPEEFDPIEPAVSIYHYNGNTAKTGGLRVEENGHKVVYVGVDMGMIADADVRTAVIAISHDWFAGLVSTEDFDKAIQDVLGQNYPNPVSATTTIPLEGLDKIATITITDATGRVVATDQLQRGQIQYDLDVTALSTGSYFYQLSTAAGTSVPKKLQVVR